MDVSSTQWRSFRNLTVSLNWYKSKNQVNNVGMIPRYKIIGKKSFDSIIS